MTKEYKEMDDKTLMWEYIFSYAADEDKLFTELKKRDLYGVTINISTACEDLFDKLSVEILEKMGKMVVKPYPDDEPKET